MLRGLINGSFGKTQQFLSLSLSTKTPKLPWAYETIQQVLHQAKVLTAGTLGPKLGQLHSQKQSDKKRGKSETRWSKR